VTIRGFEEKIKAQLLNFLEKFLHSAQKNPVQYIFTSITTTPHRSSNFPPLSALFHQFPAHSTHFVQLSILQKIPSKTNILEIGKKMRQIF